jgi:hypothetical protein
VTSINGRLPRFKHPRVDAGACGALALIGLLVFWVGIRPIFDAEDKQRQLGGQLTESRHQLSARREEYSQVNMAIEATRERLKRSAVVLHTADGLAARQEEVSRAVVNAGIELEQLMVGTAVRGSLLDTIPLHLSGKGTFPQVVAIMHELRTEFPDMAITSFQMSGAGTVAGTSEKSEPTVRFLLDIAWYTARSEQTRG